MFRVGTALLKQVLEKLDSLLCFYLLFICLLINLQSDFAVFRLSTRFLTGCFNLLTRDTIKSFLYDALTLSAFVYYIVPKPTNHKENGKMTTIVIIDVDPKVEPETKDQIVAWDIAVVFSRPKSARPKTYRIMPAQMTALQQVLGVPDPMDCVGKRVESLIMCDDIKPCLESVLGPIGATYAFSAVPA